MSGKDVSQLERELSIAESSLAFLRKEHQKILTGLHHEIARLTQKCSELQFSVTLQGQVASTEELLKEKLRILKLEYDVGQERLRDLEKKVKKGEEREREMVQQRAWDRIQMENQIESLTLQLEDKNQRLADLKRQVVVEVDIAKLQARVKELYKDGNASNQEKIQEISRKARSPDGSKGFSEKDDIVIRAPSITPRSLLNSSDPLTPIPSSTLTPIPSSTLTRDDPSEPVDRGKDVVRENRRSKVFRHHLKRIDDKVYTDSNRLSLLTSRRTEALTSDLTPEEASSPSLYSHSNPPLSLAMKGFEKAESKYNSLPPDYKAPVSTLPPIGGFVKQSGPAGIEVEQVLTQEGMFSNYSEKNSDSVV